ncbi:substrate-binding periplasmic protein [Hydrogenophaga sp. OTU3427]|uniref:substrate-binding periplasmic protein n=1 Tax=Hydrogenophaga sp. OTU3427 TaxID=3043856 RepID=UPI00313EBD47
MGCLFALAVGRGAWAAGVGTPAEPLRLLYQERPPYTALRPDGTVEGLLATPLNQALQRAGVAHRWEIMPSQRHMLLVQTGDAPVCGVGWFRNPEREALGRFSRPIYRDLPMAGLVRAEVELADGASMAKTLEARRLTLLTKEGFSYGAQIDRWLQTLPVKRVSTGNEPPQLVRMLLAQRAEWMIVAPEEGQLLMAQHPPGSLRLVQFADVGPGLERHLYCNHSVPAELLRRVDEALPRPSPAR